MTPQPTVLKPNPLRVLGIAGALIALAVACFYVLATSPSGTERWLWVGTVFFALGGAGMLANLLPGATELRLNANDFDARKLYRGRAYGWEEVGTFHVIQIGKARHVAFNLAPGVPLRGLVAGLNAAATGFNARLEFDRNPVEVCRCLNEWRERAALHRAPAGTADTCAAN